MTTVSVLASPSGSADLVDRLGGEVLGPEEAGRLYEAMLADACRAVERSGADLVVRVDGQDPEGVIEDLKPTLEAPDEMEVVAHEAAARSEALASEVLRLQETGVRTAAVMEPSGAFIARRTVDSASMKLRSSELVVGPAPGGRVYFAGVAEPLDLRDRFERPAMESLAGVADEDRGVDFLPMLPVLDRAADLPTVVATLRARGSAGRSVPERTAGVVTDLGLAVSAADGELAVVREGAARESGPTDRD